MSDDGNGLHGIAIIGMAGRFPRAKNLSELWRNLRDGVDCVSYFRDDELDPAPPPELLRDPSYVKARGVLEDADLFDARFFDIPPRQAELMDPQNRLFLETAWHALEDAGYDPGRVTGTVGLFGGVTFSSYFLNNLLSNPDLLAAVGGYQVALGTDRDYLTTLVSYKLDLKGPSINVQTACSTSLVAVVLACQSLLAYGCDMALAGGVSVKVPQKAGYLYKPGGLDSAQGRCRAFDAAADGSVYGGGVGVVVLKRLEDALADGDAIYGVILGSAVNNDGAARVGFTAPGVEGQAEAIAQAQALAGVDPATIGYVECHGTGTALGDPIEVAALSKAFRAGAQGELPWGFCALGSIKTNIGHCSAAAGVAGLIKATLALAHRQIPPTLHFEKPNPAIGLETTPFRVSTHLTDWETNGTPRRAGVSSFGLGGTNAHVVLEEAPETEPSGPSRPWQLLLLSARSETALEAATDNLAEDLGAHPDRPLADVAFTLEVGRRAFEHRRVLVCRDTEDARAALAGRDPRRLLSDVREGGNRPVAFLFPGVGDHYAGMARGLYETEPTFREELDRCCDLLAPRLGRDLRPLILAERASGSNGPDLRRLLGRGEPESAERPLDRTLYAQPAVFAVEYALARLLFEWGLRPEAMLGYSLGEYVAACLAGVMSLEDALALVAERSRLIDGLAPGAMLAVPLPEERVRSLVAGSGLDLAAVNGPAVCVIAGPVGAVEALKERLAGEGVPSRRLPTTHAFHSHRMEPVAPALSRLARGLRLQAPKIPYVSNVTGTWITAKEATDPEYWARHLCQPVRFGEGLAALWQNPDRVLLEAGPGFGLSTLALQLPAEEGAERIALPSLPNEHDPQPADAFLLGTLGKLWLAGVEIDWAGFYTHEQRRRVRLPLYPFERVRYWVEPRRQPARETAESLPPSAPPTRHVRPRLRNAWVPPETAIEKAIAGLFGELLGIEGVGLHDSFFELGGHSLLGTSLLSRLRALYGVELPLRVLFEEPTVAGLAMHVAEGPDVSAPPPLVPVPRDRDLPLSFAQQRLWFLDRLMPGNPFYNLAGGVRLTGPLDIPALRRSLREVVRRHETLRTGFAEVEGSPVQRIAPQLALEIPVLDLSHLASEERETAVRRIAGEQARAPFDLTRPGLLRVTLLRLTRGEHVFLWAIHHIVSDAWSNAVLMGEVAAFYAGKPLPALPIQYADFAVWQRQWLSGETLERQLAYWRERLAGAPVVELPTDRPRPAVQTFRGATYRITYGKPLLDDLTALARQRDASLFMALLASFDVLLCRFTGQEDVVVGTPVANRTRPELERLIGFFVNTLVLRIDSAGDPAFPDLLARVKEVSLGAFAHQDLPFEQLVEELQPRRDLSRNPLFQVMFNLLNAPPARVDVAGGLEMGTLPAGEGAALFDLHAYVTETPEGLRIAWEHNTDLFDRGTIERLSRSFETLLSGIVASPEARLWDLPLLAEEERRQLLVRWNDTAAPSSKPGTIHALFEAQVERTPEAVALVFEGETLTYAELNARANRAAHHLRASGVGPEVLVGLQLERSVSMVVAVLAVLKAGGAYVPLDPSLPAERLAWVLEDSGAALVLTEVEETGDSSNPEPLAGPGNLAYVLYTSGSTGRPKGVAVTHGAVANFLASVARWPGLGPEDAVLAVTTLSFDIAGYELLLPLTVGARIVLVTRETALDGARLTAVISEERVTRVQVTPATWRLLLGSGWAGEPGLMALSGGESLSRDLARELLPRAGSLWNFYGPTEATIWSSVHPVTETEGPIPIGLPIANTAINLLDPRMEPVPLGVPGELYIGGAGLARGYLHRPDLTAERFVPDPFSSGERLYRTGDLARRLPGGEIDFLGRADHQVKIRGFRVEPGEIEAVLAEDEAVRQAVVVLREDEPGDQRLVAYVVWEEAGDPARLRDLLASRLPAYMIPSAFVALEAFPLTPSGKVDRRALPAPGSERGDLPWVEPATETERTLAGIWSALLRLDRVGREDDFFERGGHSLLATQLVARVRDAFGIELPLPAVFRETTLAALAARIDREAAPPLPKLERRGHTAAPLSYTQRGLWFLDRMEPASPTYILSSALRLTGRLDVPAFSRSFQEVVDRHDALRATFAAEGGEPVQRIAPALALRIPLADLRALPEPDREAETRRLGRQEARRPFDLAAGPLLRVTLLRLGEDEHVALFALHHIAADGWSLNVLVSEVAALYSAFSRGLPSPLPPLPLQYLDWVEWQRELLSGEARDVQLAWWTERLAGAPALDLPTDRPRPAVQTTRVAALGADSPGDLGTRSGATPFMVLLAAFEALLSRVAGQDDFVVGTPIANRRFVELEELIGLFINTLALRTDLGGASTFADLLARVRETTIQAYAHQDLPLEVIVPALGLPRDLSRAPLFQVLLQVQNAPAASFELPELTLAPVELGVVQAADYDLVVTYVETPRGLAGTWVYNTDLFDRTTAARLARSFHTLLQAAVTDPSRPVASLPILPESERWQVLGEWNAAAAPGLPDGAGELRRLFEIQAARVPDAPALSWEEGSLSYGDLNRRANRLAHGLRKLGVGPEVLVGLLVERSPAMIVGMLGVLKAGGAYLPLDPSYPAERLDLMLGDAAAALVLTEARLDDPEWTAGESEENPEDGTGADFPAYVIYTSGSTGTPKGVVALNRGLAGFTRAMAGVLKLGPGDRFLEFPSFSFDASLVSVASTLASGAALVLHRDPTSLSIGELLAFCAAQRVTHLDIPVAFLRQIVQELAARGERGFGGAPVRALLTGGESLSREALLQWAGLMGRDEGVLFLSSYGPTETTVTASVFTVTAREAAGLTRGNVPLGRPLPGVAVLVLDGELSPVPVGVPGEVWIGGSGVTRGYLRRPDLTADAFRPDPLSSTAGERIYRTGDRARWLPDGHLEFLGRADHQVKVRGFRIELGEIEAALARHPSVEHSVVVAVGDGGERRLVAHVVPAGEAPADLARGLRTFLRESLPEAMVPSAVVLLDRLPVTPGGKVDRRALPRPDLSEAPGRSYTPPRGEIAETLAVVWARLLGVDRVGAEDDFFDLGGHSLLATQLVSRVREVFGVELPLRRLFETPTLQALAAAVEAARGEERGMTAPPVVPVSRDGDLPLSFAQERLWFLDQLQPGQPTYNMPSAVRMSGPLAPAALERAFAEVVRRHEALRTTFPAVAGRPVQRIAPPAPFPLPVVDLGALPAGEGEHEAARSTALEAARPFDLANGPLLRAGLLRLGGGEHLLLATVHHIVSDGWSMGVLIRELGAAYQALAAGTSPALPNLPVQYVDWAVWQRQWLQGEPLEAQLAYWRRQLGGDVAVLELPADRPRPAVATFRGDHRSTVLPAALTESLEALARREEATLFMTLLAAFDVLLARLTGQTDVPVGTPVAGRSRGEVEGLIGLFLNTLVLREDLAGDPAFRDLLARLRGTALDAFAHQDLPFERLVEDLQPRRTLNQTPLFQVMLVLQNAPGGELGAGDLTLSPVATAPPTSRFDLTLILWAAADGLHASAEYRSDLFEGATVERWLGHFRMLLEGIIADPGRRISDLPLLTPAERDQIVAAWNDTAEDFGPPACLHDLFYEQAARTPDAPAILWKDGQATYGDLARQADRLARRLREKGVGPGDLVALLLDPSPERVAAVLAVLRAGAAYVPLDPAYPADRLDFMLEDTGAALLLDRETLAAALQEPDEGDATPFHAAAPDDRAYVIYTSGSTGRPKGVVIRHAAAVNTVRDVNRRFGVGPKDRVFAVSALSFDLSVYDLFGPLAVGGAVVLPEPSPTPDPAAWSAALARHGVTIWDSAPALMDLLVSSGAPLPEMLRLVLLSGDWIPVTLPGEIRRRVPGARVISLGGATEASIWSILYPIGDVPPAWTSIPYGRPMANQTFHVLDPAGHPAPVGVAGELHIGGIGVADGYHARPDLTAEKFVPDPFADHPGARLYRTGDLGRRLREGTIEFLGRRDHQVKIRGFRIELGEIESVLTAHASIREAVVLARQEEGLAKSAGLSQARLVAWLVPEPGADLDLSALRSYLAAHLPEHMVPSALVPLESIPLTPNGKVDRRALPAPEAGPDREADFVPPRDGVEEMIAALWQDLLKVDRVGAYDNFFSLGGHSLLATRVAAALRDAFGVEVPLHTLFEKPTVADLALAVAQLRLEQADTTEAARLLETLEGLSDEEVEALLAGEEGELEEV